MLAAPISSRSEMLEPVAEIPRTLGVRPSGGARMGGWDDTGGVLLLGVVMIRWIGAVVVVCVLAAPVVVRVVVLETAELVEVLVVVCAVVVKVASVSVTAPATLTAMNW